MYSDVLKYSCNVLYVIKCIPVEQFCYPDYFTNQLFLVQTSLLVYVAVYMSAIRDIIACPAL